MSLSYHPCSPEEAARVQALLDAQLAGGREDFGCTDAHYFLRKEGYRADIAVERSFLSDDVRLVLSNVEAILPGRASAHLQHFRK